MLLFDFLFPAVRPQCVNGIDLFSEMEKKIEGLLHDWLCLCLSSIFP